MLLRTFGASPFLAEILIRHPGWLFWLSEPEVLARPRGRTRCGRRCARPSSPCGPEPPRLDALRVAKRREILHVGIRDLLRLASVGETLLALSATAEALIEAALLVAETELRESLGLPPPPANPQRPGFVVLGMGKLGGRELNFSSDVDLIYVYDTDEGRMAPGQRAPLRSQYQQALARRLTAALGEVTGEGYVYRVDLRLRPEGRAGSVALPASAFASYYRRAAPPGSGWPCSRPHPWPATAPWVRAASRRRGASSSADPSGTPALEEVRRLKRQIDQKTAARSEQARHVKLGIGGIREVELLTQVLQARFGGKRPRLRARGTLDALDALQEADLLASADHRDLQRAYLFLRDVENKLQMVSDAQVHVLPEEPEELRRCALRLGYRDQHGVAAGEALEGDYRRHTEAVHRIFERVLVA